jgi:tol-pal system protein YbgF
VPLNGARISVRAISADTAYASGKSGVILKTVDGGALWYQQETPVTEDLGRVHFQNSNNGFAVGTNGTILKAGNRGDNWSGGPFKRSLKGVHFANADTGWVVGQDGVILGPPEGELGTTPQSEPLNLSFDPNQVPLNEGDANAQYQAGYEAVVRGEYAFAEDQFRQFVSLFPDHPQASDATYWLGDALIQRGAYDEAAAVLLTGFESYPTSTRAPDILLKLGMALHGTGEFDTACRTYSEVLRRYPDSTQSFKDRVTAEQARAGC